MIVSAAGEIFNVLIQWSGFSRVKKTDSAFVQTALIFVKSPFLPEPQGAGVGFPSVMIKDSSHNSKQLHYNPMERSCQMSRIVCWQELEASCEIYSFEL